MQRPDETWHRLLNWTYGQTPSERLAAQVLLDQGFTELDPSHPLGGKDGGKDALAQKNGKTWIMAVYFPRGQQSFKTIADKFKADFAGVAKNGAQGIAFVTNQELTLDERKKIRSRAKGAGVELYHLERLTTILDQPHMAPVRQQYLYIDPEPRRGWLLGKHWDSISAGDIEQDCLLAGGQRYPLPRAMQQNQLNQRNPAPTVEGLLVWRSRIPAQLIGRATELAELDAWANSDTAVGIKLIHGEGGRGKSRLAAEFGMHLQTQGWACLHTDPQLAQAMIPGSNGTLLIIDYPELYPQALENLMHQVRSPNWPGGRWRLLLLARRADVEVLFDLPHLLAPPLALQAIAEEAQAWDLFCAGWQAMQEILQSGGAVLKQARFETWLARDVRHREPLLILAFALNLCYAPEAWNLNRAQIVQSLVQRECLRIKRILANHPRLQYEGVLVLKAFAALSGGWRHGDITALKQAGLECDGLELPTVRDLKQCPLWLHECLPEMQPDIFAAQLLHHAAQEILATPANIDAWLWQCLTLGGQDSEDFKQGLRRLARLSWDDPQRSGGEYLLIDALRLDLSRAEVLGEVFDRTNTLEVPFARLAVAVGQMQVAQLETRAETEMDEVGPELARLLNNLANRLADNGERAAALQAIQKAVQIREDVARQNFAAYGLDLASSLQNLSLRLAENGERAAALQAIQRAVQIYDDLARQNVAAYGPDLASSLNNLANSLAESGERAAALQAIQRAVQIYEDLARQNVAAYGPALASSLRNLSAHLAENGERAVALQAIQRAVQIYEDLARQNVAAYGPDLAMSLNNLSVSLAENGERAAALPAIQRAVQIYEDLARQNGAAYGPALANSLNNLAVRLADNGERAAALQAIQRAVQIYDDLARQNVAAYGPALAMSLNNLSLSLAENGERAAALPAIQRAVQIREDLAKQAPARFEPDLALSLANMARLEPAETALPLLHRAIALLTPYALPNTQYAGWLAWAQHVLQEKQKPEADEQAPA